MFLLVPVLADGTAAEELGPEVGKEVAKDYEHGGIACITERAIDSENPDVEEEDGLFVAAECEVIYPRSAIDPLEKGDSLE